MKPRTIHGSLALEGNRGAISVRAIGFSEYSLCSSSNHSHMHIIEVKKIRCPKWDFLASFEFCELKQPCDVKRFGYHFLSDCSDHLTFFMARPHFASLVLLVK